MAKVEARRLLAEASQGKPIAEIKRESKKGLTLAKFGDQYLTEYAKPRKKPKTFSENKRYLQKVIGPMLGKKRLDAIRKSDVAKLHNSLSATPTSANRALALLAAVYNVAIDWGYTETNPCLGIRKFKENRRERFLAPNELALLAQKIEEAETELLISPEAAAAIRLLMLTGCRKGEILSLRWEFVDIEGRTIELPDSKTGKKTVYLNDGAAEILRGLGPRSEGWVLPGRRDGKPLVNIQKPWRKICGLAEITGVRIHDLRHSYASIAAGLNMGLPIIGKLLGHTQQSTTQRYSHMLHDPLRAAAQTIGAEIARAMNGQTAEVLDVPAKHEKTKPDRARQAEN